MCKNFEKTDEVPVAPKQRDLSPEIKKTPVAQKRRDPSPEPATPVARNKRNLSPETSARDTTHLAAPVQVRRPREAAVDVPRYFPEISARGAKGVAPKPKGLVWLRFFSRLISKALFP